MLKHIFFSVMAKLNFQQPSLQSSVSHDPSEIILIIWFVPQEKIFVFYEYKSSKEQHLKSKSFET